MKRKQACKERVGWLSNWLVVQLVGCFKRILYGRVFIFWLVCWLIEGFVGWSICRFGLSDDLLVGFG